MTPIEAALEELEPRRFLDPISISKMAEKHGVARSTLQDRWRGLAQSREAAARDQRKLDEVEEKQLVQYIISLTKVYRRPGPWCAPLRLQ
jgi:transposase-like protein